MNAFRLTILIPLIYLAIAMAHSPSVIAEKKHPAEEKGLKSGDGDIETDIKFVNKSKKTIKVYWIDQDGERKHYATVEDGETHDQMTYLGHPWLITDADDNAWYIYFPDAQPRTVEIKAPEKK